MKIQEGETDMKMRLTSMLHSGNLVLPSGYAYNFLSLKKQNNTQFNEKYWCKVSPFINFYVNYYWWAYENVMFQILSKSANKWRIWLLRGAKFFREPRGGCGGLISKSRKVSMGNPEKNTYTKFYPNRTIGKGWKIGGTQNWGEEEDTRSRCQICRFQTVITFFLRETLTLVLKYVLLVYWISRHIWNLSNLE